jgi:flagellar basal-body rod protein FlgC
MNVSNSKDTDGARGLFRALEISSSGLRAERTRMDVIASNIANSGRTGKPGVGPYRRREVRLESVPFDRLLSSVKVSGVSEDPSPFEVVSRPGHPDADREGRLELPNVNIAFEMVDMIVAARTYEANLSASRMFREMAEHAMSVLK